jgi:hypothetical protein
MLKKTTEDFIMEAKTIHGNKYDYSKSIYKGCKKNICIICPVHGEFWQTPQKHLAGHGCINCHRESIAKKYALGIDKFVERANRIYDSFYDYSEVNYVNSNTYVKIICPIHGAFEQVPSSHLRGHGCPSCGKKTRIESKTKWNRETCYKEAKNHKSRIDFKLSTPTAYTKARENGWLKDYTWFVPLRKELGFWTKEQCLEEAHKYKTKTEFMIACPTAYTKSLRNGWDKDYTWFTNEQLNVYKGKVDCVYSYCFEEEYTVYIGRTLMKRKKARDREHVYKDDRDAVAKFAKKIGSPVPPMIILEDNLTLAEGQEREKFWIEFYREQGFHILNKAATGKGTGSLGAIGHGKWNRKSCYKEAQKYKNATAFEKGCGGAYSAALTNGWLSDYTWFVKLWEPKWDKKACYEEAKKYKTRGEFQKGAPTAYSKSRTKGWLNEFDWLATRNKFPVGYWDDYENCFQEATKYNSRSEFEKGNISAYQKARKRGWIDDYIWFKEKQKNRFWNKETCFEEAKKYKSATEFAKHAPRAYQLSYENGWNKDYTWFIKLTNYWTYEACKVEAAKYAKRSHFKSAQPGAYTKSRINGWLDDFFPKDK